jgi:hypothetical protein
MLNLQLINDIPIDKVHLNDVDSMPLKKVMIQVSEVLFDTARRSTPENMCVAQDSHAIQCAKLYVPSLVVDSFRPR